MNTDTFLKHFYHCSANNLYIFKVHALTHYRQITKPHVHMCCIVLTPHVVCDIHS